MHLVQLRHPKYGRKVAWVDEPDLLLLRNFKSVYEMAREAIHGGGDLTSLVKKDLSGEKLGYDPIYNGASDWRLLPSFDHPGDPMHLMLSGTGLTHKASAENRQKMHEAQEENSLTDSMKMYLLGLEGGRPEEGRIGVQPEWFYKGNGAVLRAHGEALEIPSYGEDGGEEPEIAGIYLIDELHKPWRIGLTTANEFSDHLMERKNYLYLAPSKIRNCVVGPELVVDAEFGSLSGTVGIYRNQKLYWEKGIHSGEAHMAHSLANLEYHHFKYDNHRVPGQAHIHFFGADAFSFGEQLVLEENDVMQIHWRGMGRPLKNLLKKNVEPQQPIDIHTFY